MVRGQENKEFWQDLLCMMVLCAGIAVLFFWLMKVLCFPKENRKHVMKPSEAQHSVSESGVAGGFCTHSQEYKEPPQVCFEQKNAGDLPKSTETWSDDHLPIDIILLTVERCDLLSCFSLLDKPFKSYKKEIGYVYFGGIGDTSDQEKLKIALVKCCKGAATPGGSLTAVLNAVRVLRPKAAFAVGTCISLGLENVKMGDVVISCKLTAEGFRTPVSPLLSRLIQDAPYGWVAPLQNPDEMEVKVHCDGDILSQSLREKCRCDDVFERYPGAVAIETGGEGLYAAAYDANIEWLIVKGVASYFHESQSATSEWMSFASTMAASMVAKLLKDPTVFREWPHYNQGVRYGTSEDQHSLRWNGDKIIKLLIQAAKLSKEQQEKVKKNLTQLAQTYQECHNVSTDNDVEALEAFTEYLISVYGFVLIAVGKGSVIIILECIALESLERVWNDYVSGRLDEVAEGYLVTDKMKKELKLETNCLKTTIHKENYLNCKKALMELPSTYSDSRKSGWFDRLHASEAFEEQDAAHVEREKKASNEDRAESSNNPKARKQSALHASSYQVIMAEARINPNRLGGFDDEFVDKVDDDLICTICRLPVKEAVQAWPCGHRFCYICIDSFIARQGTAGQPIFCPIDRPRVNKEQGIYEDKATDRKILSYTIKCPNSSRSCQWRGELRAKENHLATCPHEIVPCTNKNCNVKLERKRLRDHKLTKCDWRTLQCKFCGVSQPALRMRGHHKVCPKVPVTCPLKCGMTILREKVADHKENQCELVEMSCPYSKLGCREKFQRKEKTSHLQSCMQVHLDLACVKLTDTEEELQTIREKLEQTISALENRPGPYVYTWKIGGFEEILRQAKTGSKDRIESDPFYTGECGYKFKMRLYPNGRYSGENTHLSLFLINMEGEYDAILQWPCAKDVTLTLIDQQRNLDDRQTISFFFSSLGVWKSRPVKKQEVVWGRRTFVSHDELQKRAYIVDDTIFIQAKFE